MVERFFVREIIQELGPTGLLVIGLYFIIGKELKEIAKHIEKINEETGCICDILRAMKDKECGKS